MTWWYDPSTKSFVDTGTPSDHNASASTPARINAPVAGTTDDELYRTYRRGTFAYRLPVANGTYEVTLKFAGKSGVFNVNAERQRTITGLDVQVTRDDGVVAVEGTALCYTVPLR